MKQKWKIVGGILAAVAISICYVRLRFMLVELSYDVTSFRQKKSSLEQEKRALTLELAKLQNPARIEKIARSELHLTHSEVDSRRVDLRKGDQ